ncbi:5-formyltetrahydrofolate cyclo-ligase [Amycolatopsis samaneae]|uniref:5-formyltetrahydrofolate cyclo-ligase n=1 Tax=Amycolatopsis samaneae TaxID=664691 RepID=A0ABW5GIC7_9PSEU
MQGLGNEHPSKAEWRTRLTRARAEISPERRAADAAALAGTAATLARGTVCAYLPFGTEPGSVALLDALLTAGAKVLLPIVPPVPGPLEWAAYAGEDTLVDGRFRGVREPSGPRLGPRAVGEAELVLVPALGVDRRGVRLGRGAGFYDRSLVFAPDADLLAVVRDDELVELLPGQEHDVRMRGALTPGRGVVRFTEV